MSLNNWFKNILGDSLVKNKESEDISISSSIENEEETIDLQKDYGEKMKNLLEVAKNKINNSTYNKGIEEFAKIKRDLMIKDVKQKIENYDVEKQGKDKKYTKLFDIKQENEEPSIDKALDVILEKKLDVFDRPEELTEESKKLLEKQKQEFEKRKEEHDKKVSSLKKSIQEYDKKKKDDDDTYKTFDEVCLDSDWDDIDEDMNINLQEKLNVYDEHNETEEIKKKRKEKLNRIDKVLKKYQQDKLSNQAI